LTKFVTFCKIAGMEQRTVKLNVMLTPTEARLIEDLLHQERRRSISTLVRDLLLEALAARGKEVRID
jgi:hypothetical protein